MILPDRFAPVAQAFQANLSNGADLGARFTLVQQGRVVFDIWGGFADRARARPFGADTLTPVFSTTKAIAAILIAQLVDQGRLAYEQTVASVWPEFAQAGKGAITVAQVMSHQDGLAGLPAPMDPGLWLDWTAIVDRLAAMAPLWPPGAASGYHPMTYGFIAGEIFRRVDGRTMGCALREDLAEPFGLDLWIGLPDAEVPRVAELERPTRFADFGKITEVKKLAFLTKWAAPGGRGTEAWRRAEIPSANGHATALALARLMNALACGGELDGRSLLRAQTVEALTRERIFGQDLVLPFEISWAAGLMRNPPNMIYGPGVSSFGHSGWGGSCAFADPECGLSGAYVMNRQSPELIGDPRAVKLIQAAYACL
ncbi:serine hydrolase domain-containing protein [Caulobacter sp. S45]|uniref:serine hydrolase domain-containing protein n=1 Tax=Caulobacter sp. S45 TaxID=1641861 RepID=UPI001577230C|nr:serine hydrolase domain-containing protein [Caulobacter sp. S45]